MNPARVVLNLNQSFNSKSSSAARARSHIPRRPKERNYYESSWLTHYTKCYVEILKQKEISRPKIFLQSPQIAFRATLIMKMRNVSHRLNLGRRVLHAAVRLLDIFMDAHEIVTERLLLVALVCVFIAAKYELKGIRVPRFAEICECENEEAIPQNLLCSYEFLILKHVNWGLCDASSVAFLDIFNQYIVSPTDHKEWMERDVQCVASFERFKAQAVKNCDDLLDISHSDKALCQVTPSLMSAACLHSARCMLGLPHWPANLEKLTGYDLRAVTPLSTKLTRMLMLSCVNQKRSYRECSDDEGYGTGKNSPESVTKKCRRHSVSP